jgi:hypothetical protein
MRSKLISQLDGFSKSIKDFKTIASHFLAISFEELEQVAVDPNETLETRQFATLILRSTYLGDSKVLFALMDLLFGKVSA